MDEEATESASAFGRLADPLRVSILLALWETARRGEATFSDLREAVGVHDSGHFNYHLGKLVGPFVAKTDAGYRLRPVGLLVVDAVQAGAFTDPPEVGPFDAGGVCPDCAGPLEARYVGGELRIDCPACEIAVTMFVFPPCAVEEREGEALLAAYAARTRRFVSLAGSGVCPFCGAPTETSVTPNADITHLDHPVRYTCDGCGGAIRASLGLHLLDAPPVVSFLDDHGEAPDDRPYWRVPFCVGDDDVELVAEDPPQFDLSLSRDGETLRVTVDGVGEVIETARTRER
jgi:hypothetical protein